jgi:hypothetical protein
MLETEGTRPSAGEIYSMLLPYSSPIRALMPFTFNNETSKASVQRFNESKKRLL